MALDKAAIILAAEQNVSRGTELDTIASIRLDLILDQIYEDCLSDYLSKEPPATINLTAGSMTWTVPTDYLRFNVMMLIRTDVNPTDPPNTPLHKIDFSDYQLLRVPTRRDTPQMVAINRSSTIDGLVPVGYVYPVPDRNYTARLSYFYRPSYSIATNAIPSFPDQQTLVDLLTNSLYQYLEDRRYNPGMFEVLVARYRRNQADKGIYPEIAKLDKRRFRPQANRFGYYIGFPDRG